MRGSLGRTGKAILIIAVVLLLSEDLLIFYNSGTIPALEFLVLDALVIAILFVAIQVARRHRPP